MSDTKHSPEPWRIGSHPEANSDNEVIVWPSDVRGFPATRANARRIVACVNACAGIPTEALEAGALAALLDAVETGHDESSREIGNEDHSQCGVCCALRALGASTAEGGAMRESAQEIAAWFTPLSKALASLPTSYVRYAIMDAANEALSRNEITHEEWRLILGVVYRAKREER